MKQHMRFIATLGVCFLALNTTTHAQQVKVDTGGIGIVGPVTSGSNLTLGTLVGASDSPQRFY